MAAGETGDASACPVAVLDLLDQQVCQSGQLLGLLLHPLQVLLLLVRVGVALTGPLLRYLPHHIIAAPEYICTHMCSNCFNGSILLNKHVLFINRNFTGAESLYKRGVTWHNEK